MYFQVNGNMFLPRALKVKRPAQEIPSPALNKKSKADQEGSDENCPQAPAQRQGTCCEDTKTQAETEACLSEDGAESSSEEEEPVKSFKKCQRWPGPGEPVCVMCGRYGEYICDATDNDVCSLECKANHLQKMGKGPGADAFHFKDETTDERTPQPQHPTPHTGETGVKELRYFYREDPFISGLTDEQVERIKQELGIQTEGKSVMRPIIEFEHCGFPSTLSGNLKKAGYEAPTPVQMQMVPVGLTGRDVIASADTGSGKTVAFLLPVVVRALEVILFELI